MFEALPCLDFPQTHGSPVSSSSSPLLSDEDSCWHTIISVSNRLSSSSSSETVSIFGLLDNFLLQPQVQKAYRSAVPVCRQCRAKIIADNSIRMVRHIIRVNRTTDSNGSNRSISGTLLFRIHSIFILLLSYLACQVRNSVTEMSKGPTGGIIFGRFHHAIRPIL